MMREWIGLVLGVWAAVSPWLLGFSAISILMWSNLILGLSLILINLWAIFGETVSRPLPGMGERTGGSNSK